MKWKFGEQHSRPEWLEDGIKTITFLRTNNIDCVGSIWILPVNMQFPIYYETIFGLRVHYSNVNEPYLAIRVKDVDSETKLVEAYQ